MDTAVSPLPNNMEALKALVLEATRQAEAAVQRAADSEAQLANARARESVTEAVIAHLKLQIAKLKREQYGASAERTRRLLAQMELELEDLEADAAQDDLVAEAAAARSPAARAHRRSGAVLLPSLWRHAPVKAR
jgi:transposase